MGFYPNDLIYVKHGTRFRIRKHVTGGYATQYPHYTKTGKEFFRDGYAPRLIRYEITLNGKYFFSMPTLKEAKRICNEKAERILRDGI